MIFDKFILEIIFEFFDFEIRKNEIENLLSVKKSKHLTFE